MQYSNGYLGTVLVKLQTKHILTGDSTRATLTLVNLQADHTTFDERMSSILLPNSVLYFKPHYLLMDSFHSEGAKTIILVHARDQDVILKYMQVIHKITG
jgi:hypothetical protein